MPLNFLLNVLRIKSPKNNDFQISSKTKNQMLWIDTTLIDRKKIWRINISENYNVNFNLPDQRLPSAS